MQSKCSRALIISVLLVFGCTTDNPQVPEIQKLTHVSLIIPRVSLRWSETRDWDRQFQHRPRIFIGGHSLLVKYSGLSSSKKLPHGSSCVPTFWM